MSTQQSLEELASGSLPTFGGVDSLQPSWSRSLHEIAASNKSFIGVNPQQPTASAQVLLGNRTDFGNLVATLETSKKQPPKTTEAFASIEDTRRKHRDGAIERILLKEREQTQRTLEKALERQLEEDWTREREWWMKELVGSRNLVDASNSIAIRQVDRQLEASFQSISGPTHNLVMDASGTQNGSGSFATPSVRDSHGQSDRRSLGISKNRFFRYKRILDCMATILLHDPESVFSIQWGSGILDSLLQTVSSSH
jgi:hypothetical protein